jgi:hypothetical protein
VGSVSDFELICSKLATSKGLMHLGLSNQAYLRDLEVVKALMGDRYDKLRINQIDISHNQHISADGIKVFAENIITRSLKNIIWEGSFD